jgi:hypothetical protein
MERDEEEWWMVLEDEATTLRCSSGAVIFVGSWVDVFPAVPANFHFPPSILAPISEFNTLRLAYPSPRCF